MLVLSTTNLPLAIFLYTAFIRAIPASIDEAGMVDGASKPKIFFTLILPLLKPVTATVVIMTSVGVWNEYALSNYLITDASMQPIAPRVASFFASNSSNLGVGAAAALMAALPIVVLDLVGRAARLGVERFVLDDGWFHARRTDTAGLGDWWVDRSVWPDGLKPLADAVHAHGMEFGLWFEPEMVNPDSDLYREHPDWVLQSTGRLPLPHRNQQVLDLTNPDAFAHVLEQISTVLGECGVDYVKWDHNRDLLEAGTNTRGGAPAVHEQTVAYYRLLDTLRGRFPNIQWESCASGGGRIDLGVMAHGVVADDASRAIIAHVQYEESPSNRGVWLRVPGLDPKAHYRLKWAGPAAEDPEDVLREASRRDWDPLPESGPLGPDATITGAALGTIGVRILRCHPETIRLIEIVRV